MKTLLKPLWLTTLFLLLLVAGCGSESSSETGVVPQRATPEKATSVRIQVVTPQDLDEYFTLPGSLEAWEDLTLAAEIAGPIDWVGPGEGEGVVAGQTLLTIDSVTQQANLASARVDAEIKQATMQRLERLVSENLVSRQEYDNSVNAYEAAKQKHQLAHIALQKSIVKAPVEGILDRRLVERGEYIKLGDPVAVLVQVDRLKALVDVPEKDVRYLHPGEEVQLIQAQIDTGREVRRQGKLVHLAYKADPLTRTYRAKIEVDNHDRQLRPGMIVRIEALRRSVSGAIAIPLYAVVDLDGRKVVYVESQGKARLRPVTLDRVIGEQAVLLDGLMANERLIVKGQHLLFDGAAVNVEGP